MRVRLRCFAQLREMLGAELARDVAPGATVASAWRAVVREHPALARVRVRFAMREAYVDGDERLRDGDEVAVFPPVSGG